MIKNASKVAIYFSPLSINIHIKQVLYSRADVSNGKGLSLKDISIAVHSSSAPGIRCFHDCHVLSSILIYTFIL